MLGWGRTSMDAGAADMWPRYLRNGLGCRKADNRREGKRYQKTGRASHGELAPHWKRERRCPRQPLRAEKRWRLRHALTAVPHCLACQVLPTWVNPSCQEFCDGRRATWRTPESCRSPATFRRALAVRFLPPALPWLAPVKWGEKFCHRLGWFAAWARLSPAQPK